MNETRFCWEYQLVPDGPKHLVRTAWMVDSPGTRAQIEEMRRNASTMAIYTKWWTEERDGSEPCD